MRVFILFVLVFTFHPDSISGKTNFLSGAQSRIDTARTPLILVDTFRTDMSHLVLGAQNIVSINILKDSAAISKFGYAGKDGVIMIAAKAHTTFLRIDNLLKEYKVADEDKKLRICINKTLMQHPQLILIERSEIERVEITTDRHWTNTEDANPGERFVNIVTRTKERKG